MLKILLDDIDACDDLNELQVVFRCGLYVPTERPTELSGEDGSKREPTIFWKRSQVEESVTLNIAFLPGQPLNMTGGGMGDGFAVKTEVGVLSRSS